MNRRHFLSAAATTLAAPFVRGQSKTAPEFHGAIIGQGGFRYRVDKLWSQADPAKIPVKDCHEMVQVKDGRLFMVGDHWDNQMLVFKADGTILDSWGSAWPGGHGLTLSRENGEEFPEHRCSPGASHISSKVQSDT